MLVNERYATRPKTSSPRHHHHRPPYPPTCSPESSPMRKAKGKGQKAKFPLSAPPRFNFCRLVTSSSGTSPWGRGASWEGPGPVNAFVAISLGNRRGVFVCMPTQGPGDTGTKERGCRAPVPDGNLRCLCKLNINARLPPWVDCLTNGGDGILF